MTAIERPQARPRAPFFSSGPCTKHPGWSLDNLNRAVIGRSHRSAVGKAKLKLAIDKTRALLKLPENYLVAIVPASDTGAVEMALWSLLGARGVDVLAWEAFGKDWIIDITRQLKIDNVRVMEAPYGALPDLDKVDCNRDVVFTWNGTTSGVRVPNAVGRFSRRGVRHAQQQGDGGRIAPQAQRIPFPILRRSGSSPMGAEGRQAWLPRYSWPTR